MDGNSNETVADIAKEMRGITFGEECCPDCGADFQRSNRWIEFADRTEEAHKREAEEAVARAVKAMPFRFSGQE